MAGESSRGGDGGAGLAVRLRDDRRPELLLLSNAPGERSRVLQRRALDVPVLAARIVGVSGDAACLLLEHEAPAAGSALRVRRTARCLDVFSGRELLRVALPDVGLYLPRRELAVGGAPPERMRIEDIEGVLGAAAWQPWDGFAGGPPEIPTRTGVPDLAAAEAAAFDLTTLIGDADGIYHPGLFNDRLLLGLKGTMAEAELHVLRARLNGGIRNKAARGELRRTLPVGLQWGERDGEIRFDPDQAVVAAIRVVFNKFAELGSARRVWLYFGSEKLQLPRRPTPLSEIRWSRSRYWSRWRRLRFSSSRF